MAKAYGSLKEQRAVKRNNTANSANLTRRLNVAFFVRVIFVAAYE
jgi:hypothetical protein